MPKRVTREAFAKQKSRYYAKHRYGSVKRRWTEEEVEMLLDHSIPDVALAKRLRRTVQAIHVKRCLVKGADNGSAE